jgi:glycosyltransferase involved in cell wall biosynthesis
MRVVVSVEQRFDRTPDGAIWTRSMFPYPFWTRYLDVFDEVVVLSRAQDVPDAGLDWKRVDGERVSFAPIPHYLGPLQYVQRLPAIRRAIWAGIRREDAVIMRVGSPLADFIAPRLRREGHPYGLEVVGDPHDVFAPGAVRHPLRPFFRWWFARQLRRQCRLANGVAYVTEWMLQRHYPTGPDAYSTHYSSVELGDQAFVEAPRPPDRDKRSFHLVLVGSLGQYYKAPDVVIDAVDRCLQTGLDLTLDLVGDGKERPQLEAQVAALGLEDRVTFAGQVPGGQAVRDHLDRADLFVLPSRSEGLPRALIEAMARALPAIGSTVGGFPELLDESELVPPGDAVALADKIREIVTDPNRMAALSARNLTVARAYHEDILKARRDAYYQHIRTITEAWLAG